MNTWAYLILIAALLLLATLMLYARFVSRSREKSLHHAPDERALPLATARDITPEIALESAAQDDAGEDTDRAPGGDTDEEPAIRAEPIGETGNRRDEEAYFDELQEAAAGLAMLMRSTPPAERSGPVVYAPEGEEVGAVEDEETAAGKEAAESLPNPEETAADETGADGTDEGAPVAEGEEADSPPAEPVREAAGETFLEVEVEREDESPESEPTIAMLLGEEVGERIERIDAGLDALEELVGSIESSLALLEPSEEDALAEVEPTDAHADEWIEDAA